MVRNIFSATSISLYRSLIQFSLSLLLTRFVVPEEFGIVAFVLPIMTFLSLLGDFGLSTAIVRSSDFSRQQVGAAFTATIVLAATSALILASSAAVLPGRNADGAATSIVRTLAVALFFAVSAAIPRALHERSFLYARIALIEAVATTSAFVLAMLAAIDGWGIYSLVLYHVCLQFSRSILLMQGCRRQLALSFDWRLAAPLLGFGGWIFASNMVAFLARNADNIIIGAWLGTNALGLYALAYQLMLLPLTVLSWPASSVLLSTLSRLPPEGGGAALTVRSIVGLTAFATFPTMAFLASNSHLLFAMLLPQKWLSVSDLMVWLAPAAAMQSVAAYLGSVLLARGEAKLQFWIGFVVAASTLALFLCTALVFENIQMVARSYAIYWFLAAPTYLLVIARKIGSCFFSLLRAMYPAAVATVFAVGALKVAPEIWPPIAMVSLLSLSARACLYAASFGSVAALFWPTIASHLTILLHVGELVRSPERCHELGPTLRP